MTLATLTKQSQSPATLLLRAGLALLFFYASISAFKNPNDWIGYLPMFIRNIAPHDPASILHFFSAFELLLALWLVSGIYVRIAALVTAVTLVGIVVSNFSLFAITFRDMALIFAALALFFAAQPKKA